MHIGCDYGILNGFISMGATFMTAFFLLSGFSLFYTCRAQDFSDIECITSYYNKFGQESRTASPAFPPSRA